MRAAQIDRYGPPEVLRVVDVPEPTCGPDDVVVAVHAASVNPVDYKIRAGSQRGAIRYRLPWTLGLDVSGVVVERGANVTRFSVGDAVYGSPSHKRPGTYAERVAVNASELALKPPGLTHEEAASLPLVGQTAWGCLMPWVERWTEPRVFIQAGAGGVGSFAIQLAKAHGAHVTTTCSPGNAQLVADLGAERVIDYRSVAYDDVLSDMDLVLDALGGEHRHRALRITRRGGVVASIVGGVPAATEKYGPNLGLLAVGGAMVGFWIHGLVRGVRARNVIRSPSGAVLEQITALVEAGAIRPVIDTVYPLADIARAHAHIETGHARGKVVIAVN